MKVDGSRPKILVTGVTLTGNLGGLAMLEAVINSLQNRTETITLASILPYSDRMLGHKTATVGNCDYRILLLIIAPLCLLFWPLRKVKRLRNWLAKLPILRLYANSDILVDLSGISFVDDRGIPLLWYNAALVLPALFFDIPVEKLSQAVGPFNGKLNRMVAALILKKCRRVVARGGQSYGNLKDLGILGREYSPDTSFAMDVDETARERAMAIFLKHNIDLCNNVNAPLLLISPSQVVKEYCDGVGIDLASYVLKFAEYANEKGWQFAMVPHSSDTGIKKNDDQSLCQKISLMCTQKGFAAAVIDVENNAQLARAVIGCADVFIANRFHSLVAALSMAVPVLTIGWSHKYIEAAEPFGLAEMVVDYKDINFSDIVSKIETLMLERKERAEFMLKVAKKQSEEAKQSIIKAVFVANG